MWKVLGLRLRMVRSEGVERRSMVEEKHGLVALIKRIVHAWLKLILL